MFAESASPSPDLLPALFDSSTGCPAVDGLLRSAGRPNLELIRISMDQRPAAQQRPGRRGEGLNQGCLHPARPIVLNVLELRSDRSPREHSCRCTVLRNRFLCEVIWVRSLRRAGPETRPGLQVLAGSCRLTCQDNRCLRMLAVFFHFRTLPGLSLLLLIFTRTSKQASQHDQESTNCPSFSRLFPSMS